MLRYDWTRFWYLPASPPTLSEDGFLYDPSAYFGAERSPGLVTLAEMRSEPCLVLQGEPGIGKSTEVQLALEEMRLLAAGKDDAVMFVQLHDVDSGADLARRLTDHSIFRAWHEGDHRLTLFLDSLDEGRLGVETLASRLASALEDAPVERLAFRLASRAADWPALLTDALAERWGEDRVRYLHLAPLREADVEAAARAEYLDEEAFLAEVRRRRAGPLAARPVTLRFLLTTYRTRGSFPKYRATLYHDGCLLLATEESRSRKAARRTGHLSARERLAVAARIAFVLIFSNRSAVRTEANYGDVPTSDIVIDSIVGGMETTGDVRVAVREAEIREVLDTALFSPRGDGRLAFSHQTYAEYLAAWYVAEHRMAWPQIASLLLHSDERERRVVPQLRETVARLAELGRGIRRRIIALEPEVVLASDLGTASAEHREAIVEGLLEQARREGVADIRDPLRSLASLDHPRLPEQLRAVIGDRREQEEVRQLAIDIAHASNVAALAGLLAEIALDRTQALGVRVRAVFAVSRIGDEASRRQLKLLAIDPPPDDEYDQLKGWALAAAWPAHMSIAELFAALTPPRRDYFGPYEQFLHDVATRLSPDNLLAALDWARPHALESRHLGDLVTGILRRAWDHLGRPGVAERMAPIAYKRLLHSDHIIDEDDRLLQRQPGEPEFDVELAADADRRRALLSALVNHILDASGKLHSVTFAKHELVSPLDAEWLIEQIRGSSDEPSKRAWVELLWTVFLRSGAAVPLFELIYEAANGEHADPVIQERFADVLEPIDLDSPRARSLKAQAEDAAKWERRARTARKAAPATKEQVERLLTQFEEGNLDAWWHFCHYIARNANGTAVESHYIDPTQRHGWQILDAATRTRLVDTAHSYVRQGSAEPEKWFGQGVSYWPAVAGYRALVLLERVAPERLDSLSDDVWRAWAPILIARSVYGEQEAAPCRAVIARAYRAAPDAVLETLSAVMEAEDAESRWLFSIDRMKDCWDERLANMLLEKVRSGRLSGRATEQLLRELIERGSDNAEAHAVSMIRLPLPEAEADRELVLLAARLLLASSASAGREVVWPAMQQNPTFGREVILGLASNREALIPRIEERWPEDTIASLCIWLAEQFPPSEDPRPQGVFTPTPRYNVGEWRQRLRSILEHLGTRASVFALERVYARFPTPWHAEAVRNAKMAMLRNTWNPPSPEQLMHMIRDRETRLVRDGAELVRVVRESLRRFEGDLQGETPLARMLWYPTSRGLWRPREEGDLADAIERHLRRDLTDRGIVAGREVVIRRGAGPSVPGRRTDIYVYAVTPGQAEDDFATVSLIVEVKGSWHPDVLTAMRSQLLDDYLARNQRCQHGLFVVGWYFSPLWDKRDAGRRRSARNGDPRILGNTLREQALDLTAASGRTVRSVVLNVSLTGDPNYFEAPNVAVRRSASLNE